MGLQKYVDHYSSFFDELRNLEVKVVEGTPIPSAKHVANPQTFNVFLTQLKSRCTSDPPSIPNNPHWPAKILFCAAVACGKIQTLGDVEHCLGSRWYKRLHLTSDEKKAFLTIFASHRCDAYIKLLQPQMILII